MPTLGFFWMMLPFASSTLKLHSFRRFGPAKGLASDTEDQRTH